MDSIRDDVTRVLAAHDVLADRIGTSEARIGATESYATAADEDETQSLRRGMLSRFGQLTRSREDAAAGLEASRARFKKLRERIASRQKEAAAEYEASTARYEASTAASTARFKKLQEDLDEMITECEAQGETTWACIDNVARTAETERTSLAQRWEDRRKVISNARFKKLREDLRGVITTCEAQKESTWERIDDVSLAQRWEDRYLYLTGDRGDPPSSPVDININAPLDDGIPAPQHDGAGPAPRQRLHCPPCSCVMMGGILCYTSGYLHCSPVCECAGHCYPCSTTSLRPWRLTSAR